jgi:hypothetical protein
LPKLKDCTREEFDTRFRQDERHKACSEEQFEVLLLNDKLYKVFNVFNAIAGRVDRSQVDWRFQFDVPEAVAASMDGGPRLLHFPSIQLQVPISEVISFTSSTTSMGMMIDALGEVFWGLGLYVAPGDCGQALVPAFDRHRRACQLLIKIFDDMLVNGTVLKGYYKPYLGEKMSASLRFKADDSLSKIQALARSPGRSPTRDPSIGHRSRSRSPRSSFT